jgi:hypothetical protein
MVTVTMMVTSTWMVMRRRRRRTMPMVMTDGGNYLVMMLMLTGGLLQVFGGVYSVMRNYVPHALRREYPTMRELTSTETFLANVFAAGVATTVRP